MATGSVSGLLRGPGQPGVAFLELFFDLVFVLALFRLSQDLLTQLSWTGALQTMVLLLPVLYVWFSAARFTGLFEPRHPLIQLLIISIMFGTLVVAAATPEAFGRKGLFFAGAYVTLRFGALAAVILVLRGQEAQLHAARTLFWAGISAVPWITGSFLHGWARTGLWIPAAVVEYAAFSIGYPTPRLGRSDASRAELVTSQEHLAQRYQQRRGPRLARRLVPDGRARGHCVAGPNLSTGQVGWRPLPVAGRTRPNNRGPLCRPQPGTRHARAGLIAFGPPLKDCD
jgi:hypothetical protein